MQKLLIDWNCRRDIYAIEIASFYYHDWFSLEKGQISVFIHVLHCFSMANTHNGILFGMWQSQVSSTCV